MKDKLKIIHLTIMFFLALLVLVIMAADMFFDLTAQQKNILNTTTYVIIGIFLAEFMVLFITSEDKKAFLKGNWISLLVLIPPVKAVKALKVFKVIKGMKVVKTVKIGKKLKKAKTKYEAEELSE